MMVRVRLAFFWVGSRKAMTPLETASTPVMAVHPLANTFARSQRVSIDAETGRLRRRDDGDGMAVGGDSADCSDDDGDEESSDEEISGDEEGGAGVLDATHVDQVRMRRMTRQRANVCGWRVGKAETRAPTPAEMPTAELRM